MPLSPPETRTFFERTHFVTGWKSLVCHSCRLVSSRFVSCNLRNILIAYNLACDGCTEEKRRMKYCAFYPPRRFQEARFLADLILSSFLLAPILHAPIIRHISRMAAIVNRATIKRRIPLLILNATN